MTPGPWYGYTDLLLWACTLTVVVWSWRKLGRVSRLTGCATAVLVMILQAVNEVVSRQVFQAWSFSSEHNTLIGWYLLGEPIEEYLFWWAYAWLIPFAYYGLAASWRPLAGEEPLHAHE